MKKHHRLATALAISGIATVVLVSGCLPKERVCSEGEYPAKGVGTPHGAMCQTNGQEPPEGYVRYPEGKVPVHLGDKWDRYWSGVIVDSNGNIVKQ